MLILSQNLCGRKRWVRENKVCYHGARVGSSKNHTLRSCDIRSLPESIFLHSFLYVSVKIFRKFPIKPEILVFSNVLIYDCSTDILLNVLLKACNFCCYFIFRRFSSFALVTTYAISDRSFPIQSVLGMLQMVWFRHRLMDLGQYRLSVKWETESMQ